MSDEGKGIEEPPLKGQSDIASVSNILAFTKALAPERGAKPSFHLVQKTAITLPNLHELPIELQNIAAPTADPAALKSAENQAAAKKSTQDELDIWSLSNGHEQLDGASRAVLLAKLAKLREEHRDLDDSITALERAGTFHQLQVQRLKKRKLTLKDMIRKLEAMLHPDLIA